MYANIPRSEYSRRFQTHLDALEHYNALAPISFTEFRSRNRHVTRYFIRNIHVAIRHFFQIDTSLLLEYVLCENPEYSLGLSESIKGFIKLIECFEDLEIKLCSMNVKKGGDDVIHAIEPHALSRKDEKSANYGAEDTEKNDSEHKSHELDGRLQKENSDAEAQSDHALECGTLHVNTAKQYVHYIKILKFLLNRFLCSFVEEINTKFIQGILRNFNNEHTMELLDDMFRTSSMLNSSTVVNALKEAQFIRQISGNANQENASRVLEIMLEARSDMDSTSDIENHSLLEELKEHSDLIVDAFMGECRYAINVLQHRNVLALIKMDVLTKDFVVNLNDSSYKTFLTLQLKIERYKRAMDTVDMGFVLEALDVTFTHRENTFLHNSIYPFVVHILKGTNTIYVHQICLYLIPRLYSFFVEHWAQEEGQKPCLSSLFPFLLDTYGLLLDLVVQWGLASKKIEGWEEVLMLFKELETPEWNFLRAGFLNRALRRESLKYTNTKDISEWLEDCISEPFLRYLCHVILEDVPDHDFFHQNKY